MAVEGIVAGLVSLDIPELHHLVGQRLAFAKEFDGISVLIFIRCLIKITFYFYRRIFRLVKHLYVKQMQVDILVSLERHIISAIETRTGKPFADINTRAFQLGYSEAEQQRRF